METRKKQYSIQNWNRRGRKCIFIQKRTTGNDKKCPNTESPVTRKWYINMKTIHVGTENQTFHILQNLVTKYWRKVGKERGVWKSFSVWRYNLFIYFPQTCVQIFFEIIIQFSLPILIRWKTDFFTLILIF